MLDRSCLVQRHPHAERGLDLYETPAVATEALLRAEPVPLCVWEPAAGRGAISRILRVRGHDVISSDIYDYGGLDFIGDFLAQKRLPPDCDCIVTNPPFMHANEFVAHALDLAPTVIMLLRLGFLESERRTSILEDRGLHRVHIFRNRLPMIHRDQWQGRKASSAVPFAWYRWDRRYSGAPEVHRISWRRP